MLHLFSGRLFLSDPTIGKEMGAILGFSPGSVGKIRERLRQRLQLDADDDLIFNPTWCNV